MEKSRLSRLSLFAAGETDTIQRGNGKHDSTYGTSPMRASRCAAGAAEVQIPESHPGAAGSPGEFREPSERVKLGQIEPVRVER